MAGSIDHKHLTVTDDQIGGGGWSVGSLTVAVKRLDPDEFSTSIPVIKQYIEKRIAKIRLLHHPNVTTVLDMSYTPKGDVFLVREYVAGSDLSAHLGSNLELPQRILIAHQIASAMSFLHASDVCHHNLKPSNVLLQDNNPARVKVCDVGFWATATQIGNEGKKFNKEKEDWTAPEALMKKPFDMNCDVFSFGLILYCLVARKTSAPKRDAKNDYKFSEEKSKNIPGDVWDLVENCVDQAPSKRPKFSEIVVALTNISEQFEGKKKGSKNGEKGSKNGEKGSKKKGPKDSSEGTPDDKGKKKSGSDEQSKGKKKVDEGNKGKQTNKENLESVEDKGKKTGDNEKMSKKKSKENLESVEEKGKKTPTGDDDSKGRKKSTGDDGKGKNTEDKGSKKKGGGGGDDEGKATKKKGGGGDEEVKGKKKIMVMKRIKLKTKDLRRKEAAVMMKIKPLRKKDLKLVTKQVFLFQAKRENK